MAGLILLAAAPCTAMVFVWSNLVDGEPHFTLSQVALNDTIMVVAFAPIVGLLLGLSSITRALGHAVSVGRALHRRAGDRRAALAARAHWRRAAKRRWTVRCACWRRFRSAALAADAGAAVRPARRTDHAPAGRSSRCWRCRSSSRSISMPALPTGSTARLGVEWCVAGPSALDRRQQFLRAGRGDGYRPVRLPVRRGACNRGRRSGGSAGHAVGRAHRAPIAPLV